MSDTTRLTEADGLREENARLRAELDALRPARELIENLAEDFPGGIYQCRLEPDGRFWMPYVSDRLCELLGVTREEVTRDAFAAFARVFPEGFEHYREAVLASARDLSPWQYGGAVTDSGGTRWLESRSRPRRQPDGAVVWDGIALDTTHEKLLEKEVRDREQVLRETNALGHIGGWTYDVATGVGHFEDTARKIFDLPPGFQITAANAFEFYPDPYRTIAEKSFSLLLETGEGYDVELQAVTCKGRRIWIRCIGRAEMADGRPVRIYGAHQDITDRKVYELELARRDAQLQRLIDHADTAMILLDPKGRMVHCNREAGRILDVEPRFLMQQPRWQCPGNFVNVAGEPIPEQDCVIYRAVYLGEETRGALAGVINHDGSVTRWVLISTSIDRDQGGAPQLIVVTLTDITALRETQEALRLMNERLRLHIDNAPLAIIEWDGDWRCIRWSKGAENIFGWTAEEMIGLDVFEMGIVHEDDLLGVRLITEQLMGAEVLSNQNHNRNYTKDGRVLEVFWYNSTLIGESGRAASILSFALNITKRVEAERALEASQGMLETILNTIPSRVFWKDATGRFLGGNTCFLEDIEMRSAEDLVGKRDADFLPVEVARRHEEEDRRVLDSAGPLPPVEEKITFAGGNQLHIRKIKIPMRDDGGRIFGILGVYEDIREQKAIEAREKALEEHMQQAAKLESLEILAGGIAHDFNNLLVGILGAAGLVLAELPSGASVRPTVELIETSARKASELTHQLLAYSGRGKIMVDFLDLSEFIADNRPLVEASVSRRVRLAFQLAKDLPAIRADGAQLSQILINLVINASEAMEDSDAFLDISTWLTDNPASETNLILGDIEGGRAYVCMSVRDSGPGISPEVLKKIFDPYFTTKKHGHGLGLAAVLGIVRSHDGFIRVDPAESRGTIMTVGFPATAEKARRRPTPPAPTLKISMRGTALVIDDEPPVRHVVQRLLERLGFDVITAEDGRRGLDTFVLHHKKVSLVMLDLTMPELSGREVLEGIRELSPTMPVLLMSGYSEEETIHDISGRGAIAFLQKPFSPSDVSAKIRDILSASRMR